MSNHRYHIDSNDTPSFPPPDWAPGTSDDWEDDMEGSMRLSAMAMVSAFGWLIGLGMGWLIWS